MKDNFISTPNDINTVYFGGGTPSILLPEEIELVMEALHKRFIIGSNPEITLEANPDDINKNVLNRWLNVGINRLSVGIQSFKEEELRWMNRAHTAKESLRSIHEIQNAGFGNFSVDLIFGSPLSNIENLEKNLELIFEKNIPHISSYALTVEPRTPLYKLIQQKKSLPVEAGQQAEQFLMLMKIMRRHNYDHYEISNFAKPGMRSKHNSSYWSGEAYYGFGPSAHSFDGVNKRRWNIANNALYIQSISQGIIPFEEEILTDTQRLNEYIMTSIRTMEGTDTKFVGEIFGNENSEKLLGAIQKYLKTNKAYVQDHNIVLTDEGKLFADGIAADLFF